MKQTVKSMAEEYERKYGLPENAADFDKIIMLTKALEEKLYEQIELISSWKKTDPERDKKLKEVDMITKEAAAMNKYFRKAIKHYSNIIK